MCALETMDTVMKTLDTTSSISDCQQMENDTESDDDETEVVKEKNHFEATKIIDILKFY